MNGPALHTASKKAAAARARPAYASVRSPLKALVLATASALAALPQASAAQSIGALDVRSRLGETFFAAVPVQTPDGLLDPRCIKVLANPNAPQGAASLEGVRVRVGSGDSVILETPGTVMSPVVGLRLEVGCQNPVARDFVVMDERPSLPQSAAAVAPGESARAESAVRPPIPARTRAAQAPTPRAATAAAPRVSAPAAAQKPASAPVPRAAAGTNPQGAGVSAASSDARRLAELRARSDDQAAALLELQDRLALLQKQAEVLKLQLEQPLAASAGQAATAAASSAAAAPPPVLQPVARTSEATAPTAPQPIASALAASAAAPPAATVLAPGGAPARPPAASRSPFELLGDWKVAGGLAALLLAALALKLRRRPTFKQDSNSPSLPARKDTDFASTQEHTQPFKLRPLREGSETTVHAHTGLEAPLAAQTAEWVAPPTTDSLPLPSQAARASDLPGAAMTREFHITQKFQPDRERLVALASTEEIVQQARTHYMEDGDVFKAIDLLEMAVAARHDSTRPWQALFAIYRRENMPERFERLAASYRKDFGEDESWPAVLALGRAIDPDNALYAAADENQPPLPDDLIERWLGVPLDFTAHLLANEMHDQLMDTYSGHRRRKRRASE